MLKLALVLNLIAGCCVVRCTILAGAGYVASSPYVRNVLIGTGLADLVRQHSEVMYDMSGFRYVSDQGTSNRKASMLRHEIIEVPATNSTGAKAMKPLRRIKRDYPLREEREYFENLFSLLHNMDGNACISRLVCEIGHDSKPYGVIGFKIAKYIRSLPPVTWNSHTYPYVEAFAIGRKQGSQDCLKYFGSCIYDLHKIMNFLWTFILTPFRLV